MADCNFIFIIVLEHQKVLLRKVNNILQKLTSIEDRLRSLEEKENQDDAPPEDLCVDIFPLRTLEDVNKFEELAKDAAFCDKVVSIVLFYIYKKVNSLVAKLYKGFS